MKYVVEVAGGRWQVVVEGERVWVNGVEYRAELRRFEGSPEAVLEVEGERFPLVLERGAVTLGGERWEYAIGRARGTGVAHGAQAVLKAPMPGLVVRVLVEPGQAVEAGASLVVLEAMKMENELRAAGTGTVDRVAVRPGQKVEKGEVLVAFR